MFSLCSRRFHLIRPTRFVTHPTCPLSADLSSGSFLTQFVLSQFVPTRLLPPIPFGTKATVRPSTGRDCSEYRTALGAEPPESVVFSTNRNSYVFGRAGGKRRKSLIPCWTFGSFASTGRARDFSSPTSRLFRSVSSESGRALPEFHTKRRGRTNVCQTKTPNRRTTRSM